MPAHCPRWPGLQSVHNPRQVPGSKIRTYYGKFDMPAESPPPAPSGHLKLKRIAIDTYRENVAYLNRECAIYRAEAARLPRTW